jgi:tetratricopeptide (TPR) repeat protein
MAREASSFAREIAPKLLPVLRHWISEWTGEGEVASQIDVDFVADERFGGSVRLASEDQYRVRLYLGTLDLLKLAFTWLLPYAPPLLRSQVDTGLFLLSSNTAPARPADLLSAEIEEPAYARTPEVASLLETLTNFGTLFLFCHEVAHVIGGHLEQRQKYLAESENLSQENRLRFFEEKIQPFEYLADTQAGFLCFREMVVLGSRYGDAKGQAEKDAVRETIQVWGFATAVVFLLLEGLNGHEHPGAADRGHRLSDFLAGPFVSAFYRIDGLATAFGKGFEEAIRAWDLISWPREQSYVEDNVWRERMNAAFLVQLRAGGKSTHLVEQFITHRGQESSGAGAKGSAGASAPAAAQPPDLLTLSLADARTDAKLGELVSRIGGAEPVDQFSTPMPIDEFIAFLREDPKICACLDDGRISSKALAAINSLVGSAKGLRLQARRTLSLGLGLNAENDLCLISEEIAAARGPTLQVMRDKGKESCLRLLVEPWYLQLRENGRATLNRVAVYETAVPAAAMRLVAGMPEGECVRVLEQLLDSEFVELTFDPNQTKLWKVYGDLRTWLLSFLSMDVRRKCHLEAARYFQRLTDMGDATGLAYTPSHYVEAGALEAARIASRSLNTFLMQVGAFAQVIKHNQDLLEKEDHPEPKSWIAHAKKALGQTEAARELFEQILASDKLEVSQRPSILSALADIDTLKGDLATAEQRLLEAIALARSTGDKNDEANLNWRLGESSLRRGAYSASHDFLNKAEAMFNELSSEGGKDQVRRLRAGAFVAEGHDARAEALLTESLSYNRRILAKNVQAAVLLQLSVITMGRGNLSLARDQAIEALTLCRETQDRVTEATSLQQLADISSREQKYLDAAKYCIKALAISEMTSDHLAQSDCCYRLGVSACELGRTEGGTRLLAIAALMDEQLGRADAPRTRRKFDELSKASERDQILSEAEYINNKGMIDGLISLTFKGLDV